MLGIELIYRLKKFLFSKRIIFIRHTDIPQYVFISNFGDQFVSRQLNVAVIWPDRDNLKFACVAVEIYLKIVRAVIFLAETGKLATLLK